MSKTLSKLSIFSYPLVIVEDVFFNLLFSEFKIKIEFIGIKSFSRISCDRGKTIIIRFPKWSLPVSRPIGTPKESVLNKIPRRRRYRNQNLISSSCRKRRERENHVLPTKVVVVVGKAKGTDAIRWSGVGGRVEKKNRKYKIPSVCTSVPSAAHTAQLSGPR